MDKLLSRRALLASAALASAILGAVPAVAGRSIQVDQPYEVGVCQFGQACGGFELSFKSSYESSTSRFHRAYVYAQGVISFDEAIPIGALASDPTTWGNNWFALGFSMDANYTAGYGPSFHGWESVDDQLFAFYTPGSNVHEIPDPDPYDDIDEGQLADFPLFTLTLFSVGGDYFEETGAGFGYRVDPLSGAIIGYNTHGGSQWVSNDRGLLVGDQAADTDFLTTFGKVVPDVYYSPALDENYEQLFDERGNPLFYDNDGNLTTDWGTPGYTTGPTAFVPKYANGAPDPLPEQAAVPEPATWAMMIVGFGLVGGVARRRRSRAAILTA